MGARELFFEPTVLVFVFCVDFIILVRACPFTNEDGPLSTVEICVGGDLAVCGADATRKHSLLLKA